MIRDPEARVLRAVEEHRWARQLSSRLGRVRRDALIDLHEAGWTWPEIAKLTGMSIKAVTKAAHGPGDGQAPWWTRLPEEITESAKLGPGGLPRTQLVRRSELVETILAVFKEHGKETAALGRSAARMSRAEIATRVSEKLEKRVAIPSLRLAMNELIGDGRVERVGFGRYVLAHARPTVREPTKKAGQAVRARKAPTHGPPAKRAAGVRRPRSSQKGSVSS